MSMRKFKIFSAMLIFLLIGFFNISYGAFGIEKVDDGLIGDNNLSVGGVALQIAGYLLGFVALISVAWSIKGGFQILTSASDEEKVKKGKQTILYVLLGLFTIWIAYMIVNFATEGIGGI